jgi:hypothetical protein
MDLEELHLTRVVLFDVTGRVSATINDDRVFVAENVKEVESAFKNDCFPLIIQPSIEDEINYTEGTSLYAFEEIWRKGNTLVLIDEADTIFTHRDAKYLPKILQHLLARSRHRNLAVVCAVRSPVEVPPNVRRWCEKVILFQVTYENDLKAIEETTQEPLQGRTLKLDTGEFILFPEDEKEKKKVEKEL